MEEMVATGLVVLLWCGVSFAVVIGIAQIIIIWKADPEELKKARELKKLVARANKGDKDAQAACAQDDLVDKVKVIRSFSGAYKTQYSVRRPYIRQIFGYY